MSESNRRGLYVSCTVLHRQIAAMPCQLYEVRLIHSGSRQPYPGVRRWTAAQLLDPATVGFLRIRNREDHDVYFRPYMGENNAGYILLDLDQPAPGILSSFRAQGHEPSVLVETSPRRLQAWIHMSQAPLSPSLATCISRKLAQLYAADRASADWRHVGRLATFTNRKPQRCEADGLAPWVRLIYARNCLAPGGAALIENAVTELATCSPALDRQALQHTPGLASNGAADSTVLRTLYQGCLTRLRILERYPSPDWSVADKWIARELLQAGVPITKVAAVLRHASPGFPRRHADPDDYLRRTLYCAARQIRAPVLPARMAAQQPGSTNPPACPVCLW